MGDAAVVFASAAAAAAVAAAATTFVAVAWADVAAEVPVKLVTVLFLTYEKLKM